MADLVRRYADARVGDADQGEITFGAAGKGHGPAVRRVFDRVVDQVAHHLDQAISVADHDREARVEVRLELDRRRRARPRDGIAQDFVDINVRGPDAHASRLHAVEVEHVPDQTVDAVRVIEYVPAVRAHLVWLEPAVTNELAESLD